MVKNQLTQSVNNGQGMDCSDTNVISISRYSWKLSQWNSPIENSSMLDNYIRVNMNMNDDERLQSEFHIYNNHKELWRPSMKGCVILE